MTLIDNILAQLKRGGLLRDPWARRPPGAEHPYAGKALDDIAHAEISRAIDRLRARRDGYPDLNEEARKKIESRPHNSAADYHKIGRRLREMGHVPFVDIDPFSTRIDFEKFVQEPPAKAPEPLKYHCASEAFDLMELFSLKAPTFSAGNYPFQMITQKLYRSMKRGGDDNIERACDWILNERRDRCRHRWPDFWDA
jgi:hypothetical protein